MVAAVGRPGLVVPDWVKPGAAVLDVGLTRTEEGIRGDVDPDVAAVAGHLTPMPGGTGPTASTLVLGNCMNCHSQVHGSNHPSGSTLTR